MGFHEHQRAEHVLLQQAVDMLCESSMQEEPECDDMDQRKHSSSSIHGQIPHRRGSFAGRTITMDKAEVLIPEPGLEEDADDWEDPALLDELMASVEAVWKDHKTTNSADKKTTTTTPLADLDSCFRTCDEKNLAQDRRHEFDCLEAFVLQEQTAGTERRGQARHLEDREELRLAAQVAQLKGVHLATAQVNYNEDLRWKISHAEQTYASRKAVHAKAAQLSSAELRLQFARIRDFLEGLYRTRRQAAYRQYRRGVHFQTLVHRLKQTDPRVVSLDRQIQLRLYRKQQSDLNEFHMAQTLEEAVYLEHMMTILDQVHRCKQDAARASLDLHVVNLQHEREHNERRADEVALLAASGTLEMAKLVAQYTAADNDDYEETMGTNQQVQKMERDKAFHAGEDSHGSLSPGCFDDDNNCNNNSKLQERLISISKLYDTVIWNVATNDLGLTSTANESSLYSSDCGGGSDFYDSDDDDEDPRKSKVHWQRRTTASKKQKTIMRADSVAGSGTTDDDDDDDDDDDHHYHHKCPTPIGKMHTRKLAKELKEREKALLAKHARERRCELREYSKKARALRSHQQSVLDQLVQESVQVQEELRESINERMQLLSERQQHATEQMRLKDVQLMQQALEAEDQRVQQAQENSFRQAQELISAQVFHEVRNALASVVAVSDMTNTLKKEKDMTGESLVHCVDDMLDQIQDVVNYSLKQLNEILNVSKINSGAFVPNKLPFDLNKVVHRATRMQQPKASKINLAFVPSPEPSIAVSDPDIVERMVATLISNSIKFTPSGSVQPFIFELNDKQQILLPPSQEEEQESLAATNNQSVAQGESTSDDSINGTETTSATSTTCSSLPSLGTSTNRSLSPSAHDPDDDNSLPSNANQYCEQDVLPCLKNRKLKWMAVGVADTGIGLSPERLEQSKFAISTSQTISLSQQHGAQNTGFGLYHAHLQATALHTKLQLSTSEDCRVLLNTNMHDALDLNQQGVGETTKGIPGGGTLLYFTIPVCQAGMDAERALTLSEQRQVTEDVVKFPVARFVFRPMPAPNVECFRILVADDVKMLRKGMVHTVARLWAQRYPDCPVSIQTACSSEDMLRAAEMEAFDLIVCDHSFVVDGSKPNMIRLGTDSFGQRPCLKVSESVQLSLMENTRSFFDNERFTFQDTDGSLLGLNALLQLTRRDSREAIPMLMLVSGHNIELERSMGIIVRQKPFKESEFVSSLENHAHELLDRGWCKEVTKREHPISRTVSGDDRHEQDSILMVNGNGTQLFVRASSLSQGGKAA